MTEQLVTSKKLTVLYLGAWALVLLISTWRLGFKYLFIVTIIAMLWSVAMHLVERRE